jgi:glycerol kinase
MPYLLALDQGTTSSRAIIFSTTGEQVAVAQRELRQIYPKPGWVEHDPMEIWETQLATAQEAIAKAGIAVDEIAAVGITNQRETTIVWERKTGRPVHHAIVWQDRRTADFCSGLKRDGHATMIQQKTGLVPDAYFSASKLRWLLDNVPGAREQALRGELCFGTVDTWLLWHLTGGLVHATDVSNASRTMLLNIATGDWDEELLKLFNIPREMLPELRESSGQFGQTHAFGGTLTVGGIAGDQQAALFGQQCQAPGMAKNTYGTGCFLLQQMGTKQVRSVHQLLTTVAWGIDGQRKYALEGSVFVGGAVVQWLRDGLGIIKSASDIEELARSVPDNGGLYVVPAFAGLGAPHWDQYARGTIAGITRGTTAGHFARAALEAIAFQVADLLEVINADSGQPLTQLRVDGGAVRNNLLMQFQADLLQVPVLRPNCTETTALGAAMLAGVGVGLLRQDELTQMWRLERAFEPAMPMDEVRHRRTRWAAALARARDWELPG